MWMLRSIDLKEEYERLKSEMEKAELDTQTNFQKKRGVAAQKKEAKMEKEEAEKYQKLRQEFREQEQQLRLFQLYYNEKSTEDVRSELEQKQREIRGFEAKRDAAEEEIREKKRKQGQGNRELAKIEEQIKDLELKLARKKPQFIKAKESSTHLVKKLETAKTCYEAALKANETHLAEIDLIKGELDKLADERAQFEARIQQESRSQGVSMELRDTQMKQYQKLKEAAAKRNAEFAEKLGSLQREQKLDQDSLDNETRKRNDANSKIKQKQYELEEQRTKLSKLSDYLSSTEAQIEAQKDLEKSMERDIEKAKGLCVSLENDLAKVTFAISIRPGRRRMPRAHA
jgi:structural maintenance of chromosome 1